MRHRRGGGGGGRRPWGDRRLSDKEEADRQAGRLAINNVGEGEKAAIVVASAGHAC